MLDLDGMQALLLSLAPFYVTGSIIRVLLHVASYLRSGGFCKPSASARSSQFSRQVCHVDGSDKACMKTFSVFGGQFIVSDSTLSAMIEFMLGLLFLQIRPMVTQHGISVILGEPG